MVPWLSTMYVPGPVGTTSEVPASTRTATALSIFVLIAISPAAGAAAAILR